MTKYSFQLSSPDNNQYDKNIVSETKKKQRSSTTRKITRGKGDALFTRLGAYLNTCWLAKAFVTLKGKVFSCVKDPSPESGNTEHLIQALAKENKIVPDTLHSQNLLLHNISREAVAASSPAQAKEMCVRQGITSMEKNSNGHLYGVFSIKDEKGRDHFYLAFKEKGDLKQIKITKFMELVAENDGIHLFQDATQVLSPTFERGPKVGVYESIQEILNTVNGGVRLKENALKEVL